MISWFVPGANDANRLPVSVAKLGAPGSLLTAGRDGVVHCYSDLDDLQGANKSKSVQQHTDWINGLAVVGTRVFSVSSDCRVKSWDHTSGETGLVGYHDDYVKCVAAHGARGSASAAAGTHLIATGGLDRVVKLWDVNRAQLVSSYANKLENDKGSVYSLASHRGRLVLFGDNDGNVGVLDPRVAGAVVKTAKLPANSNSSTIKHLASVGAPATGSILATFENKVALLDDELREVGQLHTGPSSSIYSVYCDDSSLLVGDSEGLITDFGDPSRAWAATTTPRTLHCGGGVIALAKLDDQRILYSQSNSSHLYSTSTTGIPSIVKRGQSGVVKARLLNNRTTAVSLDTHNNVAIHNLLTFESVPSTASFDDTVAAHQTQEIIDPWCKLSAKAGKLIVSTNKLLFQNTELYGGKLGLDDDQRFNIGRMFIHSLFQDFVQWSQQDHAANDKVVEPVDPVMKLPKLFVIVSNGSEIVYASDSMDCAALHKALPQWVSQYLLKSELPPLQQTKIGFTFQAHHQESAEPQARTAEGSRLSSSSMIRVKKIKQYISEKVGTKGELVLRVNGQVVDDDDTLATVRVFKWKQGGDVVFTYEEAPGGA